MLIRAGERVTEATKHGFAKEVILRDGVLPNITQVAVATLGSGDKPELHVHPTMYEVYFVLEGEARYVVGDAVYKAGPGDFVIVPPGAPHRQEVTVAPHRIFYWGIAVS